MAFRLGQHFGIGVDDVLRTRENETVLCQQCIEFVFVQLKEGFKAEVVGNAGFEPTTSTL